MTHTLHRRGDRKSLKNDYVILAMAARGYNTEGSAPKFKDVFRIFAKFNPVNMGNMTAEHPMCLARGVSIEEIIKEATDKSIAHAVYTSKEVVKEVLRELKKADLGISIVVSGIFDETFSISKDIGIEGPFTVNMSLGIMGKTEKLPRAEILEITTMCGHGLVSKNLVKDQVQKMKMGKVTPEESGKELARQCLCGVFNPTRAADLMNRLCSNQEVE